MRLHYFVKLKIRALWKF